MGGRFINFKKILSLLTLSLFSFLYSVENNDLEILSRYYLSHKPGFAYTINSGNSGKWFELETALCHKVVRGFS